jgi:VacB/RNase II family 3'-5' exoribonuclease
MSSHRVAGAPLDFAALRAELEVPGDFDSAALADAAHAAAAPELPATDASNIPFVTIDPVGSRDLDQALFLERDGNRVLVHYAIADVAAFVRPGSPLDAAVRARGETYYFPDIRIPLHPPVLSEGAASLLPDQVRPAVLWRIALKPSGEVSDVHVERARVRSRRQLDYGQVQADLDAGTADASLQLLRDVGEERLALARGRHAIDLDLPQQEVVQSGSSWRLELRAPLPVERYNAEISILTGMCAAQLMLDGRVGVVRTVPRPDSGAVDRLHRVAAALGIGWPSGVAAGDVLATLDRADPRSVALLEHAASLLRGASYAAFDGSLPNEIGHAGIGAPYAHVTAPLRRLVDRFATEICLAIAARQEIPQWARGALPTLPEIMQHADQLAHAADRAVVDMTEAWLLQDRVGEMFQAMVIDADESAGTVLLDDPPVRARCDGAHLPAGERIAVRLVSADVANRTVRFEQV